MSKRWLLVLVSLSALCEAKVELVGRKERRRSIVLSLRGGDERRGRSMVLASKLPKPSSWQVGQVVDSVLAGLGCAGSFALLGALEPRIGVKLFVPPMMASGIIFFSPVSPPSAKGFLLGTVGCASVSAAVLTVLTGVVSPIAAQGCAAGALLMWYKATGCIFPPAAVLCVLMAGLPTGTSAYSWVAAPWVAGHACLYASAMGVSKLRAQARWAINRSALRRLASVGTDELRAIFSRFDVSKDGSLDATELKMALRVAIGADVSLADCQKLIASHDIDGTSSLDFKEFCGIVKDKSS